MDRMHNVEERDIEMNVECLLCKHMGGAHACINSVPQYVSDNIDKVDLAEMCKQIAASLAEHGMAVDAESVQNHIQNHSSEKKVVLHGIMQDLRSLMKSALQHSVVINEETCQSSIDHKASALYLDTVKQVVALYRTT
jgi:hypothetical protein